MERSICPFFLRNRCAYGNECIRSHSLQAPGVAETIRVSKPTSIPCKFFAQGYCRLGNRCRYSHEHPGDFHSLSHYRRPESDNYQTHLGYQSQIRNTLGVRADHTHQKSLARAPQPVSVPSAGFGGMQSTNAPAFSFRAVENELHLDTIKSAADLGFRDDEVYSAPVDLSGNELRIYQSEEDTFNLGSIPLIPPPLSACVPSKRN